MTPRPTPLQLLAAGVTLAALIAVAAARRALWPAARLILLLDRKGGNQP